MDDGKFVAGFGALIIGFMFPPLIVLLWLFLIAKAIWNGIQAKQ